MLHPSPFPAAQCHGVNPHNFVCLEERSRFSYNCCPLPPPSARALSLCLLPSLPRSLTLNVKHKSPMRSGTRGRDQHSSARSPRTRIFGSVQNRAASCRRPGVGCCTAPAPTRLSVRSCDIMSLPSGDILLKQLTIASTQRRAIPQLMAARHRRSISRLRIMHPTAPPSLPTRLAAGIRTCDGQDSHSRWQKGAQRSVWVLCSLLFFQRVHDSSEGFEPRRRPTRRSWRLAYHICILLIALSREQ